MFIRIPKMLNGVLSKHARATGKKSGSPQAKPHEGRKFGTSIKVICVGGAPSSGTTLLADILDSIPGLLCGPEANVFCLDAAYRYDPYFKERASSYSFPCNAIYAPKSRFFNRKHTDSYGVTVSEVDSAIMACQSLPEFVHWLASRFSEFRGRHCMGFVEKTPINVGYIRQFLDTFDDGHFIVVIRDGRSVVSSLKRRGFSLIESGMIWMYQTSLALPWLQDPRVTVVRFEDMVKNPFEVGSTLASKAEIQISAQEIEAALYENAYRQRLSRVASWRVQSSVPDIRAASISYENLSSQDLALLDAMELGSVFSPTPFVQCSFRALQQEFGYTAGTESFTFPKHKINSELELFHKTGKHLGCQMVFTLPWHDPRREKLWAEFGLREFVGREEIDAFWSLYGATSSLPNREELERVLSELSDRTLLPTARNYQLRKTHVNLVGLGSWRSRLLGNLSALTEMHLQLHARRAYAKQALRIDDAFLLALTLHEYFALCGRSWAQEGDLLAYAAKVIGASAMRIREEGWTALPAQQSDKDCEILYGLRDSLLKHPCFSKASSRDVVTDLLLQILSKDDADEQLIDELGSFFDPVTGIIYTTKVSQTSPAKRRIYTRPIFLLFLLALAKRKNIAISEYQRRQSVALTRETGGAGMGAPQKAARLIRYSLALSQLPELEDSYDPVGFETFRLEFEEQLQSAFVKRTEIASGRRCGELVLSIRHDVDRPLSKEHFYAIRNFEKKYQLRSSWYFKPETFDEHWVDLLIGDGLEIGYHASDIASGDWGFSEKIRTRYPGLIRGCTFHGGFGSAYWLGRSSVAAAQRLGYLYTENPADVFTHPLPCRFGSGEIYLTPAPVRLQSHSQHVQKHLELLTKHCGHVILENHPDRFDKNVMDIVLSVLEKKPKIRSVGEHVNVCIRNAATSNAEPL